MKKKEIVVLGAGKSGLGASILAKKKGYNVLLSEKNKLSQEIKNTLKKYEIDWEEKTHSINKFLDAECIIKSPGIPDDIPLIHKLKQEKIPVISEIEFASKYTTAQIIGITGTNGKTTTASLIYHLMNEAGLNVCLAGNIGNSFAEQVAKKKYDYYVLELSSFQLDGIDKFLPHVAIITNISPDHLDRYDEDFQKYISSKMRIFKNQKENDFLIYNMDDEVTHKAIKEKGTVSKIVPFSTKKKIENGTSFESPYIKTQIHKTQNKMNIQDLNLQGRHNLLNAMAAITVADILKISNETIRKSLMSFKGVEHRLEHVLKIKDVKYINDSKATNINATYFALESIKTNIIWIAGGVDKGNDYSLLMPFVRKKVKAIVCLGTDNSKLVNTFNPFVRNMIETQSMTEAVKIASKLADRNETVLLSPACASFDLFKNYEERGLLFKEAIRKL